MTEKARLIVRKKLIELLEQNCGYVEEQKAEELADYLLENEVIALPVKLGQEIYITDKLHDMIWTGKIEKIECDTYTDVQLWLIVKFTTNIGEREIHEIRIDGLGKYWFLTKKEALKALEEDIYEE